MGLCTSLNCPQPTVAPGSSRHNMEEQNRRGLSEVHRPIKQQEHDVYDARYEQLPVGAAAGIL
jgi:hypothetical protein